MIKHMDCHIAESKCIENCTHYFSTPLEMTGKIAFEVAYYL